MDAPPSLNPSLGKLVRLPLELRRIIWKNFTLQRPSPSQALSTADKIDLRILRTCRQIYEEVSGEISQYKEETFEFLISPHFNRRRWVTMRNSNQTEWYIEDLEDAISRGFLNLPYKMLQGVRVEITAPDRRDQGQVICLWKKVRDLVNLLEQVELPPKFEIFLRDSDAKTWVLSNGKPMKSISRDPESSPHSDDFDDDYEVVLMPFCRLRNLPNSKIHISRENLCREFETIGGQIEEVMKRKQPFLKHWPSGPEDPWRDTAVKRYLDEVFLQFDRALDNLEGPTAAMLRLDRFSSWYTGGLLSESKYEKELFKHVTTLKWWEHAGVFHMDYRYKMMRALNPLSAKVLQPPPKYFKMSYLYPYPPAEDDGWDRDRWYQAYPEGIQPLNSSASRLEYLKKHNDAIERCWVPSLFEYLYPGLMRYRHWDHRVQKVRDLYQIRSNCLFRCKSTDMKEDGDYILLSPGNHLPDDITVEEWRTMDPPDESGWESC